MILSSTSREMQDFLDAVKRHATAVSMHINASKTKVVSAFIPCDQCLAASLAGEQVSRFDVRRERSGHRGDQKGRVYQAVVRLILLYGCETWPVGVVDEKLFLTLTESAAFYT